MTIANMPRWLLRLNLLIPTCVERVLSIVFPVTGQPKAQPKYNLKDFTVWCVRVPNDSSREHHNVHSGPCIVCLKRLRELGFGKVAFSNNDGDIETHKLSKYKHAHFTSAQRMKLRGNREILDRSNQSLAKTRTNIKFNGIKV